MHETAKAEGAIKALVLSCDAYHPFVDHMIATYEAHWPGHPFQFRVPCQSHPAALVERHGDKIHPVRTRSDIRGTMLDLTAELEPEEWVYWCIDDKYLLEADEQGADRAMRWIRSIEDPDVCAVSIARARLLLRPSQVSLGWGRRAAPGGQVYLRRRSFAQIWLHQFVRVKLLRAMFEAFPDRSFRAKEMDAFVAPWGRQRPAQIPERWQLYVSRNNHLVFGESTTRGKITENCAESFVAMGLPDPGFERSPERILIGRLGAPPPLRRRLLKDLRSATARLRPST